MKLIVQCHRHTSIQTDHVAQFLVVGLNKNLDQKISFKICIINLQTKSLKNLKFKSFFPVSGEDYELNMKPFSISF